MPRLDPIVREELTEFEDLFGPVEQDLGYVPNAFATMARKPDILRGIIAASRAIFSPGKLSLELKSLIGYVSSNAGGCRFCQSHMAQSLHKHGATMEKILAVFEFETSPLFSAPERAALRLALHASMQPNAATDEDFEEVKKYFDEAAIVEIVAVAALFGFMNRWNDTFQTELEASPQAFIEKYVPELAG